MALIQCPECGKEISDTVKECPNCGYQLKKSKQKKFIVIMVIIAFALVIFGCVFYFSNIKLNDEEKADVDYVISAISNIGEVQENSEIPIAEAERLYNNLSLKCQRHVKNYDDLLSAREQYNSYKADETINLITKIGTVTLDSQEDIDNAQNSYEALTEEQQLLVTNEEELVAAKEQLSNLRVENVNEEIAAIGTVTLNSKEDITDAKKAYDNLPDNDKEKVKAYDDLVSAEKTYEELSVKNCIELIDDIGQVTLDSEDKINAAKKAYNLLFSDSKNDITNYDALKAASEEYKKLVEEEEEKKKVLNAGDSFSSTQWEIVYKKANITAKVLPNNTSGYYLYYYANDDQTFIDLVFQIKNINVDILSVMSLVGDCKVEYDGTSFSKNYNLYTSSGSNIDAVYMWDGLDALESTTLHVAIPMPREIQTNDKSILVRLTIAEQEKIINVR
jgi:hypothetical protein